MYLLLQPGNSLYFSWHTPGFILASVLLPMFFLDLGIVLLHPLHLFEFFLTFKLQLPQLFHEVLCNCSRFQCFVVKPLSVLVFLST